MEIIKAPPEYKKYVNDSDEIKSAFDFFVNNFAESEDELIDILFTAEKISSLTIEDLHVSIIELKYDIVRIYDPNLKDYIGVFMSLSNIGIRAEYAAKRLKLVHPNRWKDHANKILSNYK